MLIKQVVLPVDTDLQKIKQTKNTQELKTVSCFSNCKEKKKNRKQKHSKDMKQT